MNKWFKLTHIDTVSGNYEVVGDIDIKGVVL